MKVTRRGLFKLLAAVPFVRNLPVVQTALAPPRYVPMVGGAYSPGSEFHLFKPRYYEVSVPVYVEDLAIGGETPSTKLIDVVKADYLSCQKSLESYFNGVDRHQV